MAKLNWLILSILVAVILNLLFLDYRSSDSAKQIAGLKEKVNLQAALLNSTTSLSGSNAASLPVKETSCPEACLAAIAAVTPVVIREIEKAPQTLLNNPIAPASNAAKEYQVNFGSGRTFAFDWEDIPGLNAYIDTTNYPNIKSVRFEGSLRIPTANGRMYARLFNKTDKHPVWFSEITTENNLSTLLQSEEITLDGGNKLYQVQMKSTLKAESLIDSARIKIILK